MAKINPAINAGVHASVGFEFQKHCAIHMLLSRYHTLNGQKYFLCLEHHDDLIFCFLDASNLIQNLEAYQAKKSGNSWSMGSPLFTILKKLTQTGLDVRADPHPKTTTYTHSLEFLTNSNIKLHCGTKPLSKRKSSTINETNDKENYAAIDATIQSNLVKGMKNESVTDPKQIAELNNLSFAFIDLPKKARDQKNTLVGLFHQVFATQVNDPSAALDTLLLIFRNVENTLNSGNTVGLLDVSKRVTSQEIETTVNIITTKTKAYEFWRKREDELCRKLGITLFNRQRFALQFQNSIDFFKDKKQSAHSKILKFAKANIAKWLAHTDEADCIEDMFTTFKSKTSTTLNDLDLKAAICAAYVEIKG